MKINSILTPIFLSFLSISAYANEVSFNPSTEIDSVTRSDSTLVTEVIILNSERIDSLEKKIAAIEKKINKNFIEKTEANAIVSNVKSYAHLRTKPFGKIKSYIPLNTPITVKSCNLVKGITWCEIFEFSGGYIAKSLLKIKSPKEIKHN